jgi:hypothetical protein
MSPAHVWICGRCGARVVATVGAIAQTFQTHAERCPALPRRRPRQPGRRPSSTPESSPKERQP